MIPPCPFSSSRLAMPTLTILLSVRRSIFIIAIDSHLIPSYTVVRPASYGSHFGMPALVWPHMTVSFSRRPPPYVVFTLPQRSHNQARMAERRHGSGAYPRPLLHGVVSEFLRSGKGLGGSSSINFLCWTKPPARDIDGARFWFSDASGAISNQRHLHHSQPYSEIEKLGNPGWNWANFEKYCGRAEG